MLYSFIKVLIEFIGLLSTCMVIMGLISLLSVFGLCNPRNRVVSKFVAIFEAMTQPFTGFINRLFPALRNTSFDWSYLILYFTLKFISGALQDILIGL